MTGVDFQDKLDAIVLDLQTKGKGRYVQVALRDDGNNNQTFTISSDANGVVNAAQLADIQAFINDLKPVADSFTTEYEPVKTASEAFRVASIPHQALSDAATAARVAFQDALNADPNYQATKTALDTARNDPAYIAARDAYQTLNISENFGNISDAKGKYGS